VSTTVIEIANTPVGLWVRRLHFRVIEGPATGAEVTLDGSELSVGSHASNQLVIADTTVSRFHFRVTGSAAGYRLVDTKSANGVRINGIPVRDGFLIDGARIDVGNSAIVVSFQDDEAEVELSAEPGFGAALGRSIAMRRVFAVARRAAAAPANVLLLGETGTGKDVLAHAIHDNSQRSGGPFVVFDCSAVSPQLIESELFGHARGAFTGAHADHVGVFERASGGTLLLDEIGELPPALQPKLLRALESNSVRPVGGTDERTIDVRLIAATNQDLRDMVSRDRFRSDLYYRLAVVPIELPPLRDRPEDIPLLAGHFLRSLVALHGNDSNWVEPSVDELFGALVNYRWPGNVRELRNVVERAVTLLDPTQLDAAELSKLVDLRSTIPQSMGSLLGLQASRERFDREYLRDVLAKTNGNVKEAAEIAQIHPKSLERLLRKYKVSKQ
jgi:transcriptional regulator with GAF, ATPase, and Fis domain